MHLIPNSNGEDNAPVWRTPLTEFNACHNPAGPGGGEFCSAPDAIAGGGPSRRPEGVAALITRSLDEAGMLDERGDIKKKAPRQTFRTGYEPDWTLQKRMLAAGDKKEVQEAFLRQHAPEVVRAAERFIADQAKELPAWKAGLQKLARDLGFTMHTSIEDEAALKDAHDYVFVGPLKSVTRTAIKSAKYGGDVGEVRDAIRGAVAINDMRRFPEVMRRITELGDIVHMDDRMSNPLDSGYRDFQVILRLPSGRLAELQIITKPMLHAKQTKGHKLYDEDRVLPADHPRKPFLSRAMRTLYNKAWASSGGVAAALAFAALLPHLPR